MRESLDKLELALAKAPGLPRVRLKRLVRACYDDLDELDSFITLVLSRATRATMRRAAKRLRARL